MTFILTFDFGTDGEYTANITGDLSIHGETKVATEKATITVAGGNITVGVVMDIALTYYGNVFANGKPSKNIVKTVKTTVKAVY